MSDGDNATPGRSDRASGTEDENTGDDNPNTPEPRDRRQAPRRPGAGRRSRCRAGPRSDAAGIGNPTDGITVADLIAKLDARPADRRSCLLAAGPKNRPRNKQQKTSRPTNPPTETAEAVIFEPTPSARTPAARPRGRPDHRGHGHALGGLRRRAARPRRRPGVAPVAHHPAAHRPTTAPPVIVGRVAAAILATCAPAADRRCLAVAVDEEQQPQPGRRAGPELPRHRGPQRAVRRREHPDRRRRQPDRARTARSGAGTTDDAAGRAVGHHHAGQHSRRPQTRCGRVASRATSRSPRSSASRGTPRPGSTARSPTKSRRCTGWKRPGTETKLNSAYAVGGPNAW